MIVVVTGGRFFNDDAHMFDVLDKLHAERPIMLIRNGGMTGADAMSSYWAYSRKVNTDCVGAQWGSFGSGAGAMRNHAMLIAKPRPDLVVAFPGSAGTTNCVNQAKKLGIPVQKEGARES